MFKQTLEALCYIVAKKYRIDSDIDNIKSNEVTEYVVAQYRQLPFYHRLPIFFLTIIFSCFGLVTDLKFYHRLALSKQQQQIRRWQNSCFTPAKLLVRFFQSLIILKVYSAKDIAECKKTIDNQFTLPIGKDSSLVTSDDVIKTEVAIIGSGPGGAITAALLVEAGFQVLLIEEGELTGSQQLPPYSAQEFAKSIRYGGLGVTFGHPITYLEARCVGGGSEINSGLYVRPMTQVLNQWQEEYQLKNCTLEDLTTYLSQNEELLKVSQYVGQHPCAGELLAKGARLSGWKSIEVKKWREYSSQEIWSDNSRQPYLSMSKSFLPGFIKDGGHLLSGHKVEKIEPIRIKQTTIGWQLNAQHKQSKGKKQKIQAKHLFVAAGAVQTPALLRRSHIKKNIGNNLQSSLIIKVIARFKTEVNSENMGMPVQQVTEFSPRLTFGCGISNRAQLALGLQGYPDQIVDINTQWQHMAIYSIILTSKSLGKVRNCFSTPWVNYKLSKQDWLSLSEGLKYLSRLLLAAGAFEIYPVMELLRPLSSHKDIDNLSDNLAIYRPQISALHLTASCPMGENPQVCATNSYGKVIQRENLYINDASLLCSYPGANPQATIMAVARRNVEHFIEQSKT